MSQYYPINYLTKSYCKALMPFCNMSHLRGFFGLYYLTISRIDVFNITIACKMYVTSSARLDMIHPYFV